MSPIYYFYSILILLWIRTSSQCAPHGVSRPWSQTVCNHHVHREEHFYFDNRTIYNKIMEIEKRIDNIEKKENISPMLPDAMKKPDCQMCLEKPQVITDCDNCHPTTISSPFDYYGCLAVSIKCETGSSKLQLSDNYQIPIVKNDNDNDIVITCQKKGTWVHISKNVEQKVEKIQCLV